LPGFSLSGADLRAERRVYKKPNNHASAMSFAAFRSILKKSTSKIERRKEMNKTDSSKLSRKQLIEYFERERQEWLSAGMSEADIFSMHFGEGNENGRGGDYRTWLSERKHTRPDHKYSPGTPVAIDAVDPNGAWISGGQGGLDDVEFNIDLEAALSKLTELQRFCFIEVALNGRTQESVAAEISKSRENVKYALGAAKKNLKKYFS
jgi:RNA polymerase sigma factor (sigma-70 family)